MMQFEHSTARALGS